MIEIHHITSFDVPGLEPYRTMRRSQEQRDQGIFVAEGAKVVQRLLESSLHVISVMLPDYWLQEYIPYLQKRTENVSVYVGTKELLETLTGFSMYQGVLAVAKVPTSATLEEIIQKSPPPRLLVAVDSLSSAENMGSVVRNCAAFGVQGIIVGETCASPYLRRAVRSSMGTLFKMPVIEVTSLKETLLGLKQHGIRCVAAHPHTERKFLHETSMITDTCIVLGSEGDGINPVILETCDEAVAVPMQSGVDSLNVGNAAAVFLYEANRQRWVHSPKG